MCIARSGIVRSLLGESAFHRVDECLEGVVDTAGSSPLFASKRERERREVELQPFLLRIVLAKSGGSRRSTLDRVDSAATGGHRAIGRAVIGQRD